MVKLVHSTLYDALKAGASDIHLETTAAQLVIKYRIDGVLSVMGTLTASDMAEQVISRIKVMAELDIAERRIPAGRPLQGVGAAAARSTSAFRSCRASSARTRCCVSSTSRR